MYRAHVPSELDVLDSPLLSPTPLGSALLGNIPGSALAERIFNDPGSWEASEEDYDDSALDQMSWLVDDVEKFGLSSASSSLDSASTVDGNIPEKSSLVMSTRRDTLMDIKRRNIRPISLAALFERSGEDIIKDIQPHLLKGLELTPATADVFTPTSGSTDGSSVMTAATDKSEFLSPAPIYSASTTLSFLDLYLESPAKDGFRKSIYARSRPRTPVHGPTLKIVPESASTRPVSILSPSLVHPDMSVLPLKRGSSVPPLDTLPIRKSIPEAVKLPSDIVSPEPQLSLPPGLSQGQPVEAETAPVVEETPAASQVVVVPDSIVRALPQPTPPPAYSSRQSSPPRPLPQAHPSPSPSPAPGAKTAGIIGQAFTPVRRLPSIPPSTRSAVPTSLNNPCNIASPLPTSLPTATSALLSPEPTPSTQTILYHSRPMSAVRSPLGGPMGPRTRVSAYNRHERNSSTGNRIKSSSGLARRPPVLQL